MWGILGVKVWDFHLGLAFLFHVLSQALFCVIMFLLGVCVSLFSFFLFFVVVFKSAMWSNHQVAVPLVDNH